VTPSLSVVICTHNRPSDLERCLEALCNLDERPELIVVDSASQPPCQELVERYVRRLRLKYVREHEPGLSRARNRGAAVASGEIVAFLDDDATPHVDWARRIMAPFEEDPAIGCVGGACHAVFAGGRRPHWLSDRLLQFAGITNFGPEPRAATSSVEWPFGANMAFRAEALEQAGPFAETLGRSGTTLLSGEESALIESVRSAGWTIWLEPRAVVDHTVHQARCRSPYYWRRLWCAGVSRARATEASATVALRLIAAAPVRLCLYGATRDRVFLYRVAETGGFLAEGIRIRRHVT
jgi:glycosyltransferase involved in cell wall biosynthesis